MPPLMAGRQELLVSNASSLSETELGKFSAACSRFTKPTQLLLLEKVAYVTFLLEKV
jgi:hypothetical protein